MVNLMAQLVEGLPTCCSTEKFDWSGNLKEFSLTSESVENSVSSNFKPSKNPLGHLVDQPRGAKCRRIKNVFFLYPCYDILSFIL